MQTIEGKQAQDIAVGDKIRTYTYAGWTTETVLEVEVEQVTEQELKWWPAGASPSSPTVTLTAFARSFTPPMSSAWPLESKPPSGGQPDLTYRL
jgi:hypothetical protein